MSRKIRNEVITEGKEEGECRRIMKEDNKMEWDTGKAVQQKIGLETEGNESNDELMGKN